MSASTARGPHAVPRFFSFCTILVLMVVCASPLFAQEQTAGRIGLPQDWSSRHMLFTNGASPEVAARTARDPRNWFQWAHKSMVFLRQDPRERPDPWFRPLPRKNPQVDWAVSLGPNGGMPIGETPAKFSFSTSATLTTANCTNDFVVFTINATPVNGGQANIVALNNLYTGTTSSYCPNGAQTPPTTNRTTPTFMWSYAVGAAAVSLSPVLSMDGKKVAFIESSNPPTLDVLTWVAGQGTDATHAVAPGSGGSSVVRLSYTTPGAGCAAAAATADSNGSPYIDYGSDVAYVGADNGVLYRITGIFNGTPTVQYCTTVKANTKLTSPVYNSANNTVYVSDGFAVYGFVPGAAGFTATSPASITVGGTANTDPIVLSPIVDSTNGFVYVFAAANVINTNAVVSQIKADLSSQVTAAIGPDATANNQFVLDGAFDNAYYTNGPKTGAGTLYACGTQTAAVTKPSLYAISFSAPNGLMNSTPAMSNNRNISTAANPASVCAPLLEFFDGTTDRLFVGAGTFNATTGANQVTEWNINTRITSSATTPNAKATGYWGGTSGFAVDNLSAQPQAMSIYFGTLSTPPAGTNTPCGSGNYCAVKLTQSGLL